MASRISYKMVKKWLNSENLFNESGMYLEAYNGFYYLKSSMGTIIVVAKNPRDLWTGWNIFKSGYNMGRYGKDLMELRKTLGVN